MDEIACRQAEATMDNDTAMISSARRGLTFDPALTIPDDVLARVAAPTHFLWGADDPDHAASVVMTHLSAEVAS